MHRSWFACVRACVRACRLGHHHISGVDCGSIPHGLTALPTLNLTKIADSPKPPADDDVWRVLACAGQCTPVRAAASSTRHRFERAK
jgi:hypothetical protein